MQAVRSTLAHISWSIDEWIALYRFWDEAFNEVLIDFELPTTLGSHICIRCTVCLNVSSGGSTQGPQVCTHC